MGGFGRLFFKWFSIVGKFIGGFYWKIREVDVNTGKFISYRVKKLAMTIFLFSKDFRTTKLRQHYNSLCYWKAILLAIFSSDLVSAFMNEKYAMINLEEKL